MSLFFLPILLKKFFDIFFNDGEDRGVLEIFALKNDERCADSIFIFRSRGLLLLWMPAVGIATAVFFVLKKDDFCNNGANDTDDAASFRTTTTGLFLVALLMLVVGAAVENVLLVSKGRADL